MTYISIHDATQEEYDRLAIPEVDNSRIGDRWKQFEVGSVQITIFAPRKEERDATRNG